MHKPESVQKNETYKRILMYKDINRSTILGQDDQT